MTTSNLIRWSGLAVILGGLLFVFGSLLLPDTSPAVAWNQAVRTTAILFALIGLYAFQVEESGLWGFLGFVATFTGNVLVMVEETPLSASIYRWGSSCSRLVPGWQTSCRAGYQSSGSWPR